MILKYKNAIPKLSESSFVAPGACVIGDVHLGDGSSLWFNVVVRGDVNYIRIGDRTNIQDGSIVHVTRNTHPTIIGNDVTVGHSATLHGCTIEDGCLIGIGAIVLDGARVGAGSLIGAGSVVAPGTQVPAGSLVLGSPGKVKRALAEDERNNLLSFAENYLSYQKDYKTEVERIG